MPPSTSGAKLDPIGAAGLCGEQSVDALHTDLDQGQGALVSIRGKGARAVSESQVDDGPWLAPAARRAKRCQGAAS